MWISLFIENLASHVIKKVQNRSGLHVSSTRVHSRVPIPVRHSKWYVVYDTGFHGDITYLPF